MGGPSFLRAGNRTTRLVLGMAAAANGQMFLPTMNPSNCGRSNRCSASHPGAGSASTHVRSRWSLRDCNTHPLLRHVLHLAVCERRRVLGRCPGQGVATVMGGSCRHSQRLCVMMPSRLHALRLPCCLLRSRLHVARYVWKIHPGAPVNTANLPNTHTLTHICATYPYIHPDPYMCGSLCHGTSGSPKP